MKDFLGQSTIPAGILRGSAYDQLIGLPQDFFDLLPVAMYVCDRDGVIARYNRAAVALWGRAPPPGDTHERFFGSFRLRTVDRQPRDYAAIPMAKVLATGKAARDQEMIIERPDGTRVVALANIEPLRDEAGRPAGAICHLQDITPRKRADEDLRHSQDDLEDFFENAAVALHWVGADGTILRANQAELDLLGYAREEYVGRHIAEVHADQPIIDDILTRLTCGETLDKYPARLRAKDGSIRHVLISSSVLFRNGDFVHTRCCTLDVTDRKRAEEAVRESRERLRAALTASGTGTYRRDLQSGAVDRDENLHRLYGMPPGQMRGHVNELLERLHPDDRAAFAAAVECAARDGGDFALDYRVIWPDGSVRWIADSGQTCFDSRGRPLYITGACVDITERKRAEEHQELLLAELNHRVKNTLAVVQAMAAQMLRRASSLEEFAAAYKGRLRTLASAHSLLTENNWRSASLQKLIRRTMKAHGLSNEALVLCGSDLLLPPKQTLSLGMALHELATNAAKYGALSVPAGRLEIAWIVEDEDRGSRLRLDWLERDGPAVSPPTAAGFGTTLIRRTVAYDLEGEAEMRYEPEGLRCRISFPWREDR